jgi:hypothetical protein
MMSGASKVLVRPMSGSGRIFRCTIQARIDNRAGRSCLGISRQANLPDASATVVGQVQAEYYLESVDLQPPCYKCIYLVACMELA